MTAWELKEVTRMAWTQDSSGIYTLIHRVKVAAYHQDVKGVYLKVRLDIMTCDGDEPVQSFQGLGNNVRMHCMKWMEQNGYHISTEHAGYIGYELCRAMADANYVQD